MEEMQKQASEPQSSMAVLRMLPGDTTFSKQQEDAETGPVHDQEDGALGGET